MNYMNNSLRVIYVMAGTSLHRFYMYDNDNNFPQKFLCNGKPLIAHQIWLSECNVLKRNGVHETYAMSRNVIPPELFHVCNVFEGRGMLKSGGLLSTLSLLRSS